MQIQIQIQIEKMQNSDPGPGVRPGEKKPKHAIFEKTHSQTMSSSESIKIVEKRRNYFSSLVFGGVERVSRNRPPFFSLLALSHSLSPNSLPPSHSL